jgi:hypothetical protein
MKAMLLADDGIISNKKNEDTVIAKAAKMPIPPVRGVFFV